MPAADPTPTTNPTAVPTPVPTPLAGAGSADLATDTEDPAELRALLERARERLSFYESFDRMIGEQMRRAGEMMAETVALREQAATAARERQAADEAIRAERERYRSVLETALADVRATRPVIDAMVERLEGALDGLADTGNTVATADGADAAPQPTVVAGPNIAEPVEPVVEAAGAPADLAPEAPAPEEDIPHEIAEEPGQTPASIEVLAHGVPSAATAIGLQAMLREIDAVTRVDAREFADGELRLHVECAGPIADDAFTDWLATNSGSLVSRNAKAIELSFA